MVTNNLYNSYFYNYVTVVAIMKHSLFVTSFRIDDFYSSIENKCTVFVLYLMQSFTDVWYAKEIG